MVTSMADQLRQAIRDSGQTQRAIADACDIDEANLSAFLAGRRGLSMDAADRVCSYLDLRLMPAKPRRRRKRR